MKTKHRFALALLFCLTLLIGIHSTAYAETVDSGTWGNLTWLLDDGNLTISGSGLMDGFNSDSTSAWRAYKERITSVRIESGVTSVGSYAFTECSELTSVTLPEGLTRFDKIPFAGCVRLTNIVIPTSVTNINDMTFSGCNAVTDIYYCGTQTQWNAVTIGDENGSLLSATIHFTSNRFIKYEVGDIYPNHGEIITIPVKYPIENYIFETASDVYNSELAYYLMLLANSSYNNKILKESLTSLGFPENDIVSQDYYKDKEKYANYTFAKKKLSDGRTLVMITVRGTHGRKEWIETDFDLGYALDYKIHKGFYESTDNLLNHLTDYLGGEDIPTSDYVYVLSGHSLGAAVANLTAVFLQEKGVASKKIYDYNFACPDVAKGDILGKWKNPNGRFSNIFNIADARDIVSYVPGLLGNLVEIRLSSFLTPGSWGKFGISKWFAYDWNNIGKLFYNPLVHYGDNYINYLHKYEPLSAYKSYEAVKLYLASSLVKPKVLGVFCPVNVVVYDTNGTPIAGVVDGVANYYNSEFGDVIIYVEGDEKLIALPNDQDYDVRLTASSEGTMTYMVMDADLVTGEVFDEKAFESVEIVPGKTMISKVIENQQPEDVKLFVVDENDSPITEVLEDGTEIETVNSGTWGKLSWTLDNNGLLTISGSGAMQEPEGEAVYTWLAHKDVIVSVVIEPGVTSISQGAFRHCTALTSVTIPKSVEEIGVGAFGYCAALTDITISEGVTNIGHDAFSHCSSLKNVAIPASVTELGECAFQDCTSLKNVQLPAGIKTVSNYSFLRCRSLESVTIPEGVTDIGKGAYSGCKALASVTIPVSVKMIASGAFQNCSALTDVDYGGTQQQWSAITIGSSNAYLKSATVHYNSDSEVASGTWGKLSWTLDNNGLLTISGSGAMQEPEGEAVYTWLAHKDVIVSVVIEPGVTSISQGAFRHCTALTSVTIPKSVEEIGVGAFGYCAALTDITISEGVTSIGHDAFSHCSSLKNVAIPASVTELGECAFQDCTSLKNVQLPAGIKTVSNYSFLRCTSLESVTIPEGVTDIGKGAFSGCKALASVTIPVSVKTIASGAFQNCSALTDVYYGGTQQQWSAITIGSSNAYLKNAAIHLVDGSVVYDFILPDSLTTIEDEAFAGGAFRYVQMSEGTASIGSRAFADCPNLRYIYIPEATGTIAKDAFEGVTGLTILGKSGSYAEFYAQRNGFAFSPVA